MAGRPKLKADRKHLAFMLPRMAEEIWDAIETGKSVAKAAEVAGVSKRALDEWLEHPDRVDRLNRARARASDHMMYQAIEIADGPAGAAAQANTPATDAPGESADSPTRVMRDKLRVHIRELIASRWNREVYGESKQPSVTVNLATLHLDALRQHAAKQTQPQLPAPDPDHNI